jgi:membrane protease YdiL (CAAX protease family)
MTKKQDSLSLGKIIASLVFYTLLWAAVTDAWGISTAIFGTGKTVWQQYIYDISCRVIWVLPVFFLLEKYKGNLPVSLRDMLRQRINVRLLLVFLAAFTAYAAGSMLLNYGGLRGNPDFLPFRQISFFLVVGVVEELVYRGWGLNALLAVTTRGKAITLSAVFFVLLHWPAYFILFFTLGTFAAGQLLLQSLVVLVISLILGYVFVKNKSIVIVIILHAYFDFIVELLAG